MSSGASSGARQAGNAEQRSIIMSDGPPSLSRRETTLVISNVKGSFFPRGGLLNRSQKFYIIFESSGKPQRTAVSSSSECPVWKDELTWVNPSPSLGIKVYASRTFRSDALVFQREDLIELHQSSTYSSSLIDQFGKSSGKFSPNATLQYAITVQSPEIQTEEFASDIPELTVEHVDGTSTPEPMKEISRSPSPSQPYLSVVLYKAPYMPDRQPVLEELRHDLQEMSERAGGVDHGPSHLVDIPSQELPIETIPEALEAFMKSIEVFVNMIQVLAEIHPYAKAAAKIMTAVYQVVHDASKRDDKLQKLITTIRDIYTLIVTISDDFCDNLVMRDIADRLTKQTVECGHFILDYLRRQDFWTRALISTVKSSDAVIEDYENNFTKLMLLLQTQASVQAYQEVLAVRSQILGLQMMTTTMLEVSQDILTEIKLHDIPYVEGASFDPGKRCLEGTRQNELSRLILWANAPVDLSVGASTIWIKGVAGSGKSALAHTLSHIFREQNRLGSAFFFDAYRPEERGPTALFRNITRDLAARNGSWRKALYIATKIDPSLRQTASLSDQFDTFLLEPTRNITFIGPIMIVIDALDESGSTTERSELVTYLARRAKELPPNFRFLIFSRPEKDLASHFSELVAKDSFLDMHAIDPKSKDADVRVFFEKRLSHLSLTDSRINAAWPNQVWIEKLVKKSEGLFQWAHTACEFITARMEYTPYEGLIQILSSVTDTGIDALYGSILSHLIPLKDAKGKVLSFSSTRSYRVLGRILAVREPLTLSQHQALSRMDRVKDSDAFQAVISSMGSILSVGSSTAAEDGSSNELPSDPLIEPLHTSFRDYLTDPNRSGPYYLDQLSQDILLTKACFRIMEDLQFNIGDVPTSHHLNSEIDSPSTLSAMIPYSLQYACRFWATHLVRIEYDEKIAAEVRQFCKTKILFWLEVLSLTNQMSMALVSLQYMISWFEPKDSEAAKMGQDIEKFIHGAYEVITASAPHIYTSALAWLDDTNWVKKTYRNHYPSLLTVVTPQKTTVHDATETRMYWGVSPLTSSESREVIARFSVDDRTIIASNDDGFMMAWSMDSNKVVWRNKAHAGSVNVLLCLPNGRVISGANDRSIQILNARDGLPVADSIEASSGIRAMDISPDGQYIILGCETGALEQWCIEKDKAKLRNAATNGHGLAVRALVFTKDGQRVLSASEDTRLRFWDTENLTPSGDPFVGHTSQVTSAILSADEKQIFSCSLDHTVRGWDVRSRSCLWTVSKQGRSSHQYLAIERSIDGRYLVTSAEDGSVELRDAKSGRALGRRLRSDHGRVNSVKFSHDEKYLIGGTPAGVIYRWNVNEALAHSISALAHHVTCVEIASQVTLVGYGTNDGRIEIWNTESNEPLQVLLRPAAPDGLEIIQLGFSSDGHRLASADSSYKICFWDLRSGKVQKEENHGHHDWINSLSFSPDNSEIVSCSDDLKIIVWCFENGAQIRCLTIQDPNPAVSAQFLHSNGALVSGHSDGTTRIWKSDTCRILGESPVDHGKSVRTLDVSPRDSGNVATGCNDGIVYIWETQRESDFGLVAALTGHVKPVAAVAYSADGLKIAASACDQTILVWNAESREIIGNHLYGFPEIPTAMAFSRDGEQVTAVSRLKGIYTWDLTRGVVSYDPSAISQQLSQPYVMGTGGWVYGYVYDHNNTLLPPQRWFWVPEDHREGFVSWRPNNLTVTGARDVPWTRVNLDTFKHGTQWTDCRVQSLASSSSPSSEDNSN
ncbi:WD40 repeat-like protein [Sistotremastrum niveocremeum HHB9708]|uniref:WD40 repeat-like protein n=1 Tax=Sistotremastrum niveocremeum HHB9708 TaxID=1314777 RepID=A0A164Y8I5_9AGAM|nr:WD40 repeat-like protein [Sistotremastrum niveocremeum HHB9708]